MRTPLCALALTLAMLSGAHADGLQPRHAHSVDLGSIKGVAYYTAEQDGYRLVTTLAPNETDPPVRFVAMLQPNQKVTISVPGPVDRPAAMIEIVRRGDDVVIARLLAPTN